MMEGFNIGGRNVNSIRNMNDTVLVADSVEKLEELITAGNVSCNTLTSFKGHYSP